MMNKKLLILLAIIFSLTAKAQHSLIWNTAGQQTLFNSNQTTLLTGSTTNSTIGFFAQLIYTPSATISPVSLTSNYGVGGDNVVLASSFVGIGAGFGNPNGRISVTSPLNSFPVTIGDGSNVFVRFWNAPSEGFNATTTYLSLAPLNTATHYGDSVLYPLSSTVPPNQTFSVGTISTITAVPEPGTIGLIVFGGILGMVADRRRRARR